MVSLYDIAFDFIERYYQIEPVAAVKSSIINQLKMILDMGWTHEEIMKKLNNCNNGVPQLATIFSKRFDDPNRNLLKSKNFLLLLKSNHSRTSHA